MLLGALAKNAARPDGAQALHRAVEKDHDGSILQQLGGFLGQAQSGPGDAILGHVLGARRPTVEKGISRSTGMDSAQVGQMMAMLAPMVMGALGKQQRQQQLGPDGLANLLGQERQKLEQREPQTMGLVGKLLDTDGDGDVDAADLAKHGMGLLGKLFKNR